jgi:hypothetical protein
MLKRAAHDDIVNFGRVDTRALHRSGDDVAA